jgi:hypothetical protein
MCDLLCYFIPLNLAHYCSRVIALRKVRFSSRTETTVSPCPPWDTIRDGRFGLDDKKT